MLKAETAAMIMMSGTPDLENITLAENGVYQSVDHDGFNIVTVDTPYGQCAEEVAEMLDIDTSQDWDCDDIKDKITELQNELEACHDCKDDVVAAIRQYDPSYVLPASGCPDDGIDDVYDEGYDDGYDAGKASVVLDTKTILHNGTYVASAESPPLNGFSEVTVAVPLGAKFITANGTYLPASDNLDGYNSVVVDVQSCGCYTFPDDTDIDLIPPVVGLDLLYPEDNDYYFQYCIYNRTVDIQFPITKTITYADVSNQSPYVAVFIYNTSGTHVNTLTLSNAHLLSNDPGSYFKCTNVSIDYTNKEVTVDTEYTVYNYGTGWEVRTETRTTSISTYVTTTTPNPSTTVKKKN